MFFAPLGIVYGNINQFIFSPGEIIWILIAFCAAATAVMTAVGTLLPLKASLILNAIEFSGGLCCYVQSFFLNGKMGTLTGEGDHYSLSTVLVNLLLWVLIAAVIIVGAILLIKFKKEQLARSVVMFLALSLTVMQLTAFVSTVFTSDGMTGSGVQKNYYLSDIGEYEISDGKNTVMFIIDTCDGRYLEQAISEYPDIFDGLDGFVYYPNATSTHSRTYPSMPYLLTGEICHFDKPYSEYVDEAYKNNSYIEDIKATGCNIGLYTNNQYVANKGMMSIDNSVSNSETRISFIGTLKQMGRISLYRNVPYALKSRFRYGGESVNENVIFIPKSAPQRCITSNDVVFYNRLVSDGIAVSGSYSKAFRLYHMWGAHPGGKFDQNMQPAKQGSTTQCIRGNFLIIQDYIRQMKELGVYEDSTIIITADHGSSNGSSDKRPLVIDSAPTVAMLVKPSGCGMSNEGVTTSTAPVCHADLFSTVIASLDGNYEKYGTPVWNHTEGEQRTRYYYNQALYSDEDGEIALREYAVTGDARDVSNWKLTGNDWDILYSERAVSKHRLSEVKK
ncbi:MAG: hypothetical protein ACLU40_00065 [Acutalibacteraceae bacterium]